ncbi:MAG: hypothetical protein FWC67_05070 [Defluviitaleaceae bacterium]|nr:hypothetical protein [Defluviitaleaceae bacterium]
MELINSQIDKIEDLLAKMDEVIDQSRSVPFSSKISIEKESLYSVIDEIRDIVFNMKKTLPSEVNQARRVVQERDNHLSDAKKQAEMLLRAAQDKADKMVEEHEVTQQAVQYAKDIEQSARDEANNFKLNAGLYIEDILSNLSEKMQKALQEHIDHTRDIENFYNETLMDLDNDIRSIPRGN